MPEAQLQVPRRGLLDQIQFFPLLLRLEAGLGEHSQVPVAQRVGMEVLAAEVAHEVLLLEETATHRLYRPRRGQMAVHH